MHSGLIYELIIIVILAVLASIFLGDKEKKTKFFVYKGKQYLMTFSEHEFFNTLVSILGDKYYVFPQVHLPTILDHKIKNGQNWKAAFRHIDEKSVDYVICDKQYLKPLLAIELDDPTHDREDRQMRDVIVNDIFKQADMPILHVRNFKSYSNEEIEKMVLEKIQL